MHSPACSSLPPRVLARLSPEGVRLARAWWASLGEVERDELTAARSPPGARRPAAPGRRAGRRRRLDLVVEALPESEAGDEPEFPLDYYEFLVNHEVGLDNGPRFHICTRHEAGRRAAREGRIPPAFACPLGLPSCPLRRASEHFGGEAIRFVVRPRATRPFNGIPR